MMRTTTPIISILIAILLFVFFTHPEYLETAALKAEIDAYKDAKSTYDNFGKQLEQKEAQKANRPAYEVERLDALVPEAIDETQYLVDLEGLAERHNLLFGNINVEDTDFAISRRGEGSSGEAQDELLTTDISFEVVGTYEQFKNFLRDLEKSLTLFEVTKLSLTVVSGPFQQFAVTVRTYALPKPN